MKKASNFKDRQVEIDDMRKEYHFDYRKAQPNRFAGRIDKTRLIISLDPDVSKVFTTQESVNTILRALIATIPKTMKLRTSGKSPSRLSKHNGKNSH